MTRKHQSFTGAIALTLLILHQAPLCLAKAPYHFLKEIALRGAESGDSLTVDESARRLYVTSESNVMVLDLDKEQVLGEIKNTPGVHCFVVCPRFGRGFSSNSREDRASVINLKTFKLIAKLKTGKNPGAILVEPSRQELWVFNAGDNSASVFEADDGDFLTTIQLPGKPKSGVADPKAGRVYCSIEDKNEVAAVDTKAHRIVEHWPLSPGESASGMAVDLEHHRLFLGCRNKLMVMMDSVSGKVMASVPIGEGVEACAFDPGTRLAFASCGDGSVTIAHEDTPEKLTVVQTLKTELGARTMALDPKTHTIYVATANSEPSRELPTAAPERGTTVVPGTFKLLVYGLESVPPAANR
jgi:DNA-binding beta-propeller fold protein YncE